VRLTTPRDEHTTIAIQRMDAAGACASVTVPPTGVDLVAVERALIQCALDTHDGNRTHAAQFLDLSRSALLYRMQKHHINGNVLIGIGLKPALKVPASQQIICPFHQRRSATPFCENDRHRRVGHPSPHGDEVRQPRVRHGTKVREPA
jgi:Bacterial regulatory protein, Fis family